MLTAKKKNVASVTADEVSEEETLLSGSHIAVVGSTLTVGNGKTSYTDYLEKKNGMTVDVFATKDATLTGDGEQSYKAQLDAMDKDATWDMILVEIPPTETDQKAEVGELSESEDRDTYDLETLTGAYQYIVSYCWDNWKAPAVFVTGIQEGKKDNIYDMRQAVWPVKYGMDHAYVMDLWEKLDYKDKNISTYKQKDGTLSDAGYMNWYGPALQTELIEKYGEVASDKINELPQYDPANVEALADSPLKGKKIIFLGSSVTFGSNSNEASFVEYLAARDGIVYVKEAVSGTTLVDNGETSYIARMRQIFRIRRRISLSVNCLPTMQRQDSQWARSQTLRTWMILIRQRLPEPWNISSHTQTSITVVRSCSIPAQSMTVSSMVKWWN